jgi:hypothetical protein
MNPEIVWPAWLVATPMTVLLFWLMLRAGRRLRLLCDTPTSKAKGVFIGQVELSGRALLDAPVRSYLAGADCVWFRYSVEEQWSRWETETYTDSRGNRKTRQVRKTGWTQIDAGGAAPAFRVEDETGAVQVRPDGADIHAECVFSETAGRGDALYFGKGPAGEIGDSTGHRRFVEHAIRQGATLFVAGRAREREDLVAPEIAADPEQELFVISCRGEAREQRGYRWGFWSCGVLFLLPLPVASLIQANQLLRVPPVWIAPVIAGGLALLWLGGWCWMTFNSLVQLRNRVAQAGALIDVQLKRRSDLIPRLVAVVAALRDHERSVQTEMATLRAQSVATPAGEPGPDLAGSRAVVQSVVERYPELKSDGAFLGLQRELSDTELRIALARDYRNSIATHLNTRLEIVPDRWIAPLAGLRPQPLWQAEGFEREAVKVQL